MLPRRSYLQSCYRGVTVLEYSDLVLSFPRQISSVMQKQRRFIYSIIIHRSTSFKSMASKKEVNIISIHLYNIIEPSPNPTAINVSPVWTHSAVAGTARYPGTALLILTQVGFPCLSGFDRFHTLMVGLQPASSSWRRNLTRKNWIDLKRLTQ